MSILCARLCRHLSWTDLLSFVGVLVYTAVMWHFAHIQLSVLDEGLYLYKGWLLASGRYWPFQDYGVWMNQMPLAYLIPGGVQLLFGPGLTTGRIFAFVLAIFSVLGWWLTTRRLAGAWMAAALVWAMALNLAAARMSAMAASQGLIAALLAWTMFFGLGAERSRWQLFTAGILAGVIVMVRINLILLLPLLIAYRFWQDGAATHPGLQRKAGTFWLLAGMAIPFAGLHALYWPNILRIWARWLPFPFLADFFPPPNTPVWKSTPLLGFKIASFFLAFRAYFAALFGSVSTLIFWPAGEFREQKTALFLAGFVSSSFVLHAWAALGNEYCIFCFPTYTTFYAGAGLLLTAITFLYWKRQIPAWRSGIGMLVLLVLLGGMAYSAEGLVRDSLPEHFYKRLMSLPVPGREGVQIWQIVANKFHLEYEQIADMLSWIFPVTAAITVGIILLLVSPWLLRFIKWVILRIGKTAPGNFSHLAVEGSASRLYQAVSLILLMGSLLAPSPWLSGELKSYDCPSNVLPSYDAVGAQLAALIPPGSKIYWDGYSPVTLLYLPEIEILPGQLHGVYSFRISSDDDALRRYGWWNESLAASWLAQADFVLIEQRNFERENMLLTQSANFDLILETNPQSCRADSAILVYRKK